VLGFDRAVNDVVAAISASQLAAATTASDAASNFDVLWSVVARRAGDALCVHSSSDPSIFAALAHAKPQVSVALGSAEVGGEVEVLRRAAQALALPSDARAIPFTVLDGSRKRVCGVAFHQPIEARAVVMGHAHDGSMSLEAVVVGTHELAAVGLDGNSDRFGRVTLRRPTSDLLRADVDARWLVLQFADQAVGWSLSEQPDAEVAALVELVRQLGVPLRRMVQVDERTQHFELEP
jgi:hypothetical protein